MRLAYCLATAVTAAFVVAACGDSKTPASPSRPAPSPETLQIVAEVPVSGPIANVTAGSTGTFNYAGQSVYVPAGTYTNFRFQWYSTAKEAVAFGRLYVLTQEFLGLPGDLPSAPGRLMGSSAIEAGEYVFEPSSEFQGDRMYWFYTDTQGSFATSFDIDTYAPGIGYVTGIFSQPFRRTQASGRMVNGQFVPAPAGVTVDANFRLRGAKK